jgi:hypothetical protein
MLLVACSSTKRMSENYIVPGYDNTVTSIVANGTLIDKHNVANTSSKMISIHKFKYKSHRYIIFDNTVLHDPNCECN